MAELEELKKVLRSLVVSSPTQMDMRVLLKDYRNIMGETVPIAKYGYRNAYDFLKERCSDCFLLHGPSSNPVLTLIVPDSLKHIDKHVQKQRTSSGAKGKAKRRSVPVAAIKPQEYRVKPENTNWPPRQISNTQNGYNYYASDIPRFKPRVIDEPSEQFNNKDSLFEAERISVKATPKVVEQVKPLASHAENINDKTSYTVENVIEMASDKGGGDMGRIEKLLKMKMSYLALADDSGSEHGLDAASTPSKDDDSGRHTASSGCSMGHRKTSLDEVNEQIVALVSQHPEGLWTTDLIRLYREAHGHDVPWARLGHRSVTALLVALPGLAVTRPPRAGDWRVSVPRAAPAAPATPATPATCASADPSPRRADRVDRTERADALPGLDFDEAVFPWDCVQWAESIPRADVSGLRPGDMVPVCVAEVYSPAHCWLQALSERARLYSLMDACNEYYGAGPGRRRMLCAGAVRAGQYCAAPFDGDWHRAVILRRDAHHAGTVTVRHVDYGTVTRVNRDALRPLLRQFATLPQQAIRARLAGIRPSGERGARYSLAAASRLLELVRDKALVANVCAVDTQERIVEVVLVDTTAAEDVDVGAELVRSGHAARRHSVALLSPDYVKSPSESSSSSGDLDVRSLLSDMTSLTALAPVPAGVRAAAEDMGADTDADTAEDSTLEAHLRPTFDALERGAAPPLGDLLACTRAGISLAHVPAHVRHVQPESCERQWRRARLSLAVRPAAPPARARSTPPARPAPRAARPRRAHSHPRAPRPPPPPPAAPRLLALPALPLPPLRSASPPPAPSPAVSAPPLAPTVTVPPPAPTFSNPPVPPAEVKIEMPQEPTATRAPPGFSVPAPHFGPRPYPVPFPAAGGYFPAAAIPLFPPLAVFPAWQAGEAAQVSQLECEVFVRVVRVDVRRAVEDMVAALGRAPRPPVLVLRALDVLVFRRLAAQDRDTAAAHLVAAIQRAQPPAPASRLNPHAREFSLVSSETQTEPAAASPAHLRPPPGYENYVPTPLGK